MLESARLDSFLVSPPCTTHSPARYPPLRTYAQPYGLDPSEGKTFMGTLLALRALFLLDTGRLGVPSILEQPRRSKMAWLPPWKALASKLGMREHFLDSCAYGSPRQKPFRLLCSFVSGLHLQRKCTRDHEHIKIEGKYTKPSAT